MTTRTQPCHARRRRLIAATVLVSFAVAGCSTSTSSSSSAGAASSGGAQAGGKGASGQLPGVGEPAIYWTTLRSVLAQGLNRTVTSLTQLWGSTAPSGPKGSEPTSRTTILDVAIETGLTSTRLHTLELTAMHDAWSVLVSSGTVTRSQAASEITTIEQMGPIDLDGYSMYAFQPH
jgi:hypothetical protein